METQWCGYRGFKVLIFASEIKVPASGSDPIYTVKRVCRVHTTNQCLRKLTTYVRGRSYCVPYKHANIGNTFNIMIVP